MNILRSPRQGIISGTDNHTSEIFEGPNPRLQTSNKKGLPFENPYFEQKLFTNES
jgi:hypothetical protein